MKFLYYLALIVLMSASQIKEIEMPTIRSLPRQNEKTLRPPAWLGRNGTPPIPRRPLGGGGNSGVGGGAGGGFGNNQTPNWYQEEYQGYMSPTNVNDISNPNVPVQAIMQDQSPAAVQNRIKFGAPNLGTSDTQYQNQSQIAGRFGLGGGSNQLPAWLQNRGPAYGGSYNPTNMVLKDGQWNVPQWMGGDAEVRDIEQIADEVWNPPAPPVPTYPISQGHPGGGVPVWMMPPPEEPTSGGGGMNTTYGGNWRRGGGGGYGGYGGGGAPAWLPNMGLNSWVFRG